MTQNDDAQLATWLAEGPTHGHPATLERALSAARATRQRPAWLVAATGGTIGTERTNRSVGLTWGLVAVVALIGLLIGGLVVGGWFRPQRAGRGSPVHRFQPITERAGSDSSAGCVSESRS